MSKGDNHPFSYGGDIVPYLSYYPIPISPSGTMFSPLGTGVLLPSGGVPIHLEAPAGENGILFVQASHEIHNIVLGAVNPRNADIDIDVLDYPDIAGAWLGAGIDGPEIVVTGKRLANGKTQVGSSTFLLSDDQLAV